MMQRRLRALAAGACLAAVSWSGALADVMPRIGEAPLDDPAPLLRVAEPAHDDNDGQGGHAGAASGDRVGALTVTGAFARASVIDTGAAYLTVSNAGAEDDRLVAASSPVAARAELHEMTMDGDVMRMGELDTGVAVPGGGGAELAPGRLHIMLLGLTGPLVEGETLPLTLRFEHAGELTLTVPILAPGAAGAEGYGNH